MKAASPEPFVVIDISNGYTKAVLARGRRLQPVHRTATAALNADWFSHWKLSAEGRQAVVGSVVPAKTASVRRAFSAGILEVTGTLDVGIPINFPKRKQLGADRIANAVAGQALYGTPCVIVDFGTAVTFDVIDSSGAYVGGVIAPGLDAMTDYLHERTALLPKINLREPQRVIGRSTLDAMLSGAVYGYRGLVREILNGIRKDLGHRGHLPVAACGGHAKLLAQHLPEIDEVNPLLTLEGLRIIGARYFHESH